MLSISMKINDKLHLLNSAEMSHVKLKILSPSKFIESGNPFSFVTLNLTFMGLKNLLET